MHGKFRIEKYGRTNEIYFETLNYMETLFRFRDLDCPISIFECLRRFSGHESLLTAHLRVRSNRDRESLRTLFSLKAYITSIKTYRSQIRSSVIARGIVD